MRISTRTIVWRPSDLFFAATVRACPAPTQHSCRGEARLALPGNWRRNHVAGMLAVVALAAAMLAGAALGQSQSGQSTIGEVTALVAQSRQISLKTDQGEAVTVTAGDSTSFRRVPPGAKDLTTATRIAFSDLGVGDRIIAIGQRSNDRKTVEARSVIAMSRSDLTQQRLREQEEWQKRGVAGTVSAVDPGANTLTIKSGAKNVAVQPSGKTEYRRYAADSVKFSDARPSSLDLGLYQWDLAIGLGAQQRGGLGAPSPEYSRSSPCPHNTALLRPKGTGRPR